MFFILLVIIILIVYKLVTTYNKLQLLAQRIKSRNSNIKNAISRKIELTNKLIDIVKGYADHEKLIHVKVSDDFSNAYKEAEATLATLKALDLKFPELKANEQYNNLTIELVRNEDIILERRDSYNHAAEQYNAVRLQFPTNLFASSLGFKEAPYIDLDSDDSKIKEFTTDDGELLKSMIKNAGNKTAEYTKKTVNKTADKIKKVKTKENSTVENDSDNVEENE